MNTETIERPAQGALAALAATMPSGQGLITLDPAKYVSEVFRASRGELALMKAESATVTYDITTTAGMKTAIEWRAKPKAIRLAVERIRKERKEPILEIGKLLDSQAKEIEAEIRPIENRFDADIKTEEARKEQVKAAEAQRKEQIRLRVVAIREIPLGTVGKSTAEISAMIALLVGDVPDESFGDLLDAARVARLESLDKLASAEASQRATDVEAEARRQKEAREKLDREEESKRIAAEREEMARQRAENQRIAAEHAATAKRLADQEAAQVLAAQQQRDQAEANALAHAAALADIEVKARAERDRVSAETKVQLERQQAEIAADRHKLAEQQAAADARDESAAWARADEKRQIAADAEHAEALVDNAAWDADRLSADHAEALPMDLQHDIDRASAAAGVTLHVLDAGVLADVAGNEPPSDAEIIADLLATLRIIANQSCGPDWKPSEAIKFVKETARDAIKRAEGRAA